MSVPRTFRRPHVRPRRAGFTLVETLVSVAIFTVIFVSVYSVYAKIFDLIAVARERTIAMGLANEQFEIVRNLPYGDVGIVSGLPRGLLHATTTEERSGMQFEVTTVVRSIDDPFDGLFGGAPNDTAPSDYKLVDITVACQSCTHIDPVTLTTTVAPKSLEISSSTNGALFVRALDAAGQPISGASVHVEYASSTFPFTIDDVTGVNGTLQLVDVPPGVQLYKIDVSKDGYSSERTYTPGEVANPNPTKPDATVMAEALTQLSFAIDRISVLEFESKTPTCAPVPNVDFSLVGSKLIGTSPDLPKYSQALATDGLGELRLSTMEWDTYALTMTDAAYQLIGTNSLSPIELAPNETKGVDLIVAPAAPRTLMVTVRDGATSLPISGATVRLTNGSYDTTLYTGRGFLSQTDWSGGAGQSTTTDFTRYFSSDGNVDVLNPAGEVRLRETFGTYVPAGEIESSAFDTGSISNFHDLSWEPSVQLPDTGADSVRLQIATSDTGASWNFLGPDGTASTYYSPGTTTINAAHNGHRYLKYKLFLSTASTTFTPNVSDVAFTFTSDCVAPGQVAFTGLAAGDYDLYVSKAGYLTPASTTISVLSDWVSEIMVLTP